MNYALWKTFLDAVELGSLSKVATLQNTNQPQISRQINELEAVCGGRLFNRTGRGVELTDLGQHLLPKIYAWINVTDQFNNEILHSTDTPVGTVRIASLPSTAHPLLTTLYKVLQQKYPRIKLSVREGQGVHLEKWLEEGNVDLALLYRFNQPLNMVIFIWPKQIPIWSVAQMILSPKPKRSSLKPLSTFLWLPFAGQVTGVIFLIIWLMNTG